MLSIICAEKLLSQLSSWNHTECLSAELKKVKYTKERSVDNLRSMEKEVRLIDAAPLLTELDMLCYIPYLEEL